MSRFYVSPEQVRNKRILLEGPEVRHIVRVMRLRAGDSVVCFDGTGKEYSGLIESATSREVLVRINQTRMVESREKTSVVLAQSLPKREKMDYIVQKGTELGVNAIVPLQTSRTIVALSGKRRQNKIQRWQKIAVEAAKQCGRVTIPRIEEPVDFIRFLEQIKGRDLVLIACLCPGTVSVRKAVGRKEFSRIVLLIGPEGGFSSNEILSARRAGCIPVSLGQWVLRSDTAAVAGLAILGEHIYFNGR